MSFLLQNSQTMLFLVCRLIRDIKALGKCSFFLQSFQTVSINKIKNGKLIPL